MTTHCQPTKFRMPLTDRFHHIAQQFYQHHSDPQKAKQVYLNTLSLQTVRFYLTCLAIETDLEQSISWNPTLQVLSNAADLWVTGVGRLECCPVLPEQTAWTISEDVWTDRVGYVFVQLDSELTEATLLGFLTQLSETPVTIQQLQPMDQFPAYLAHNVVKQTAPKEQPSALLQWLDNVVDEGWASLEQIFADWQTQMPAYSFRNSLAHQELMEQVAKGVKRGKFLTFTPGTQVLFLVGIAPADDSVAFDITVELYPAGQQAHLPPSLHLMVMDQAKTPVLQAEGRQSEGLEFQFSAEPGENFAVQISLDQSILTEQFAI
ncbi:DUF1822 family protein [Leptothoe sp. ISB3NOV94-8A]|nr:DUF1822 family protein [Leptothoe sp. LEGE 181152]